MNRSVFVLFHLNQIDIVNADSSDLMLCFQFILGLGTSGISDIFLVTFLFNVYKLFY